MGVTEFTYGGRAVSATSFELTEFSEDQQNFLKAMIDAAGNPSLLGSLSKENRGIHPKFIQNFARLLRNAN